MKAKIPLIAALLCIFAFSAFADVLVDSVNQNGYPEENVWLAADVGWEYTPTISYTLTGVFTKFGGYGDNRTVTVEVYDDLPGDGGSLLRSAGFTPTGQTFCGASFSPINLIAGHTYFIGFRNVANLGVNVTGNPEATTLSLLYYSYADDGSYSIIQDTAPGTSTPILEFYGHESPKEAVEQLISIVEAADMNRIKKVLLTTILFQARDAFDRNNTALGTKLLIIFQKQVNLQLARTDGTDANWFIEVAQEIIDTVEQQQNCHFNLFRIQGLDSRKNKIPVGGEMVALLLTTVPV
jgi:hypothetical protein